MKEDDVKLLVILALGAGILYMLYDAAQQESANNSSIAGAIASVIAAPVQFIQGAITAVETGVSNIWTFGEDAGDGGGASIGNPTF